MKNDILEDGESLRIPLAMMDSSQRALANVPEQKRQPDEPKADPEMRPLAEAARERWKKYIENLWKDPSANNRGHLNPQGGE